MTEGNSLLKPMLAAQKYRDAGDLWSLKHEDIVRGHLATDGYLIVQPKWDGFRMLHQNGIPMSRSGKPLANEMLQRFVREHPEWSGIDGEQLSGHNYHAELFRISMSETRSRGGSGEMMIVVYDSIGWFAYPYTRRRKDLEDRGLSTEKPIFVEGNGYNVKLMLCPQVEVKTLDELYAEETRLLALNFEGAIVRRPSMPYKQGRSTAVAGELVKVKRRITCDAIVTGYEERMQNLNEAKTSELGFTVRSSHQANLNPMGMLGAIYIQFINGPFKGVVQKTGVFRGLSHGELTKLWEERETLQGRYCEVSIDPASGGYDAGRCPVWLKWRPSEEF